MIAERLRRLVRGRIGYRSPLYRLAARAVTDLQTLSREGMTAYRQVSGLRRAAADGASPVAVQFRSLAHPLYLRPGTHDLGAVLNNVVRREYGWKPLPREAGAMIDAGGYIGDTAVYFLNRYPDLTVHVLEPDPESRALAMRNLAPYGDRVTLIPAALGAGDGSARFGGIQTGARLAQGGDIRVETVSIPTLLARIPGGRVDLLKLDIEGGERQILEADVSAWLDRVGMMIVETHGDAISDLLKRRMHEHGWTCAQYRNLYYCQPGSAVA